MAFWKKAVFRECRWERRVRAVFAWMIVVGICLLALPEASPASPPAFSVGSGWKGRFVPAGRLYPVYPADPLGPTVALNAVRYSDSDIAEAGDKRYVFRIGGRLGLLRVFPADHPEHGLQLNLHGTFLGMFDRSHSLDNIGWDGLYGIDLTWRGSSPVAVKFGINHDSSHVGDEYAERTGRKRIEYTRQEWILGLARSFGEHLRTYAETGWAFDLRSDWQEKWRLQAGLEFRDEDGLWGDWLGYYAAADLTSFEESDWEPDVTVQAGLLVPVAESRRNFRIGLEYRDGRSVIGEFAKCEESYWAWGIWIDL
ncbi:MAG TPA: DUF1207 domain-containing protein [Desulfosalsimonadaceae bacterium]|nr:DUF1207 domain-containing protein [Desulfosalsimonadaceae bacterium]